ncbi:MAG TPA: R3H domain-containing nucleic acid-binding protein [Candidatus Dojkabacteria bacterium]|jgi:spoIIIJ-associated protein|nr:R3H domain-containing nucleic acid-binding protein [Candidatus Dojkabacteria bacterium]
MEDNKIIEIATAQIDEFLTQLGLEAELKIDFMEADSKEEVAYRYLLIELQGEHLSELIGFHGKMLESLQNVLGLFMNKALENKEVRVLLDINNYRDKRTEYLTRYAQRAAEEVRMNKQPMELPPMKPFERRIIHMVLKDDPELITESLGEGEDRRVVIKSK